MSATSGTACIHSLFAELSMFDSATPAETAETFVRDQLDAHYRDLFGSLLHRPADADHLESALAAVSMLGLRMASAHKQLGHLLNEEGYAVVLHVLGEFSLGLARMYVSAIAEVPTCKAG